ncbi:PA0069 family radical SAM protein [Tropicimonas sp. IMCC6043]|uniref:PA0069 family radical SAM protein n=1 Tax=Tropicimonas sp. IMCC6043 TaxID=2510645 RepID=UPI00101C6385|nr:PA0069 family radical SAM protein [Tropicimonas sp. IMCC6043]RYH12426.1 PA0069 family radical SAM protein [Tropicimonas sp. IMCC6043]
MPQSDPTHLPPARRRGRAALSNRPGRFEPHQREAVDDGWAEEEALPPLRTEVSQEAPRRILTRNSSPDIGFDRSINPYRGCEHGCIYCFARPTHAFLGLSPGLDFETRLTCKPTAPALLRKELANPRYRPLPIAFGTNTDVYQPIEAEHRITRGCFELLSETRHPLTITTKGTLIERDTDLLGEMGQAGLAHAAVSITTLDPALARSMEPRVPGPARRLRVIERLAAAGVPVGVSIAPLIPGLTDHEIEPILAAARDAGARHASMILLRLPLEVAGLFREWLETARPERAARVMARIRETRGGADYDSAYFSRQTGQGTYAEMLQQRFRLSVKRLRYNTSAPTLRTDLFRRPSPDGAQLSLF